MEAKNKDVYSGFPLHTIKKITMVADHYRDSPPGTASCVNQLLSKGWVLLAVHTKEVSPRDQLLVFTLGHTDSSADDSVRAIYTDPEEI